MSWHQILKGPPEKVFQEKIMSEKIRCAHDQHCIAIDEIETEPGSECWQDEDNRI